MSKKKNIKILGQYLSEEERKWILDIDPRRWSIDRERPHRSIEGALFHCPVSALTLSSFLNEAKHINKKYSNPLTYLLKFYQSKDFEACIQCDLYVVDSLITWIINDLASKKFPKALHKSLAILKSLIHVEQAVIKMKRKSTIRALRTDIPDQSFLKLGDSYCALPSQVGVTEVYLALSQKAVSITQTHERAALLLGQLRLKSLPINLAIPQLILIEKQDVNVTVESLSDDLAQVLKLIQTGITLTQLIDYLCAEEMTKDEARDLVDSWRKDGLISIDS